MGPADTRTNRATSRLATTAASTQKPWSLLHHHYVEDDRTVGFSDILDADGEQTGTTIYNTGIHNTFGRERLATAELIVRAVNAHDDMLDVCIDVWFHLSDTTDPTLRKIADAARVAIAKAKAEAVGDRTAPTTTAAEA